jgi:hypothetical protein
VRPSFSLAANALNPEQQRSAEFLVELLSAHTLIKPATLPIGQLASKTRLDTCNFKTLISHAALGLAQRSPLRAPHLPIAMTRLDERRKLSGICLLRYGVEGIRDAPYVDMCFVNCLCKVPRVARCCHAKLSQIPQTSPGVQAQRRWHSTASRAGEPSVACALPKAVRRGANATCGRRFSAPKPAEHKLNRWTP